MSVTMLMGCASLSLNTLSMTDSSVDVVSRPQNAAQSLTTKPALTKQNADAQACSYQLQAIDKCWTLNCVAGLCLLLTQTYPLSIPT